MTQEDKDLLFKDLCARLLYGVKCYGYCFKIDGNHCECYGTLDSIKLRVWYPFHLSNRMPINNGATYEETFSEVKPYLFPISSMTEEQKRELRQMDAFVNTFGQICFSTYDDYGHELIPTFEDAIRIEKWLNKNHFDYRGLIEKGLALDATGLNIY